MKKLAGRTEEILLTNLVQQGRAFAVKPATVKIKKTRAPKKLKHAALSSPTSPRPSA